MTPAVREAEAAGIDFELHQFESGSKSNFGAEAAETLGVPADRVFKTLIAQLDKTQLVVAILPVSAELDLKRLAGAAGAKRAAMAPPALAERTTGYVKGGISPLGQRQKLPTVIDESAFGFETIFVSAGRRGLELEIGPEALEALCDARTADIARRKRSD